MKTQLKKLIIGKTCAILIAASILGGCASQVSPSPTKIEYPKKEIQCIVTANAGGGTDAVARAVASPLEKSLGKSIVIINNGSASGLVGMGDIANADPDGYTLGVFSNTDVANFVYTSTDCDFTLEDFTYIAALNSTGDILVLKKGSALTSLDDFISYAKENPGKLTIALPSAIQNLSLNLMNKQMNITTTGIVYEGGNKVLADLLGGHIDAGILSAKFVAQAAEQNLAVLGIMLEERLSTFPDVPTFLEQGYTIVNPASRMLVGPKGIPDEVLTILAEHLVSGYEGEISNTLLTIDETPTLLIGSELDDFLKTDFAMREEMLNNK